MSPAAGKKQYMSSDQLTVFDAGVFIAALMKADARHAEARGIVEDARLGKLSACTTVGILAERMPKVRN